LLLLLLTHCEISLHKQIAHEEKFRQRNMRDRPMICFKADTHTTRAYGSSVSAFSRVT